MTDEQLKQRNLAIRESRIKTLAKRKSQVCRVYQCKIQDNKLSLKQREQLQMMFVEAKWIYNDIIAWSKIEGNKPWEYKIPKSVKHYDETGELVETDLIYLPMQIKQEVQKKVCSSIKSLASLKKSGYKVGELRFTSEVKSIHVKQVAGLIFKDDKHVKLPNVKKPVRVNGLDQFKDIPGIEIACFDLLNTPRGYYIHFCTYIDSDKLEKPTYNDKTIGIDFGCSTSFTTSEGDKYDVKIRETDRMKKLQRQLSRKVGFKKGEKKSNNFKRLVYLIRREYQHMTNIKNDKANKLVAEFTKNKKVVIQDEQIKAWHKKDDNPNNKKPRKVHHSILGRVKAKLSNKENVVILNKFAPTTKLCRNCGAKIDMPENKRTFKCKCGVIEDRDVHAAKNMVWMYENNVGVGRTKLKLCGDGESNKITKSICGALSVKQEGAIL